MQSQALRQQTAISSQQSLAVVKTLLSASFGCIAYLRNLLPDENFGEGRLTSGGGGSMAYGSQDFPPDKDSRYVSSVSVKTVTRGFSTEADKLLNYLEHGIFDAIERQYLKSFIFAIYLDNDDPTNIVESYTYNLTYYAVPGTKTTVPIMSLDDQLNELSLDTRSKAKNSDAVAQATLKGRAPTLGDVKQSVKALVKNLILHTQHMEPLPRRRYATFKLFYRENTPDEYEPPYFRPGDPVKDKFIFSTHDERETPEKFSVGSVVTPHHGIDVQVQSIVRFLPNEERDDSQYIGIEKPTKKIFGATQGAFDADSRSRQLEAQRKDAEDRNFAWSAEDPRLTEEDAEGEDDPDYVNDSGIAISALGLRKSDGSIVRVQRQAEEAMDIESGVQFYGKPDVAPSRVGQLRATRAVAEGLEPTQQLEATQVVPSLGERTKRNAIAAHFQSQGIVSTVDTQALKAAIDDSAMDWTGSNEMLETQATNIVDHDSVQSYSQENINEVSESRPRRVRNIKNVSDNVSCACEHKDDDDVIFCETCERWFHIRCMGYHSAKDSRLPAKYVCIPCRLQGDVKFNLIKDQYPDILAAFVDLALFRRAIKIAEVHKPSNLKEFRKLSKCDSSLAEGLWNRLEREGFIVLEVIKMDKHGLFETRSRATRSTKKVESKKQIQKYVFNHASKKAALYRDYFSPDSEAEKTMIGLGRKSRPKKAESEKKKGEGSDSQSIVPPQNQDRKGAEENPVSAAGKARNAQVQIESQTQDESQFISTAIGAPELKRRSGTSSQEIVRTSKKVKISIVEENVDIEE